jgi:hypothetical protein
MYCGSRCVYRLGVLLDNYYDGDLVAALKTIYPDHQWIKAHFQFLPLKYWEDVKNQREYFDYWSKKNGFTQEDWYK